MNARAVLLISVTLALVSGCGSSPASSPAGDGIKVSMTDFHFAPSDISAAAGTVTFLLVNDGKSSHDLVLKSADGLVVAQSEMVAPGAQTTFKIDQLAAGTYRLLCDQPGHEQAGMVGTLTVR